MNSISILEIITISNVLFSAIGVIVGIIFGSLPGLTATMGVALFLPFTFKLSIAPSMSLLLGIFCGGIYGGSISAVLIKTPGTPAAAATVLDGYPLNEQGKAYDALSLATIASFTAGIISSILLILISPQLAKIALQFGPPEYFAVALFGLSMVASLSADNFLKGVLAALVGIAVSSIGIDAITGTMRFTFGNVNMAGGIDLISSLIGLFAISQVLEKLEGLTKERALGKIKKVTGNFVSFAILKENLLNIIRSSIIGTFVGIVPATGSSIGSWLSYNEAKRASKHPEKFGKGSFEGIAASEAGNNGVTGGALVPLLTLGVPGDVVTAVMLGALMIQGLTPGPLLFKNNPDVVTSIYVMLIISNVFLLIFGLIGIRFYIKVLKIPSNILMPLVLMLCLVGSFAISNNMFDLKVALIMGIIGYLFNKVDISTAPMLLGIILGPIVEFNFRRAMTMSQNSFSIFINSPISLIFIIISIFSFILPSILDYLKKKKAKGSF
jgi:putative tricarboxylic transport membrane protein